MERVAERMKEVEGVVLELHESIRGAAFSIMGEYILTGRLGDDKAAKATDLGASAGTVRTESDGPLSVELTEFMDRHESDNPADNAKAIAAYWYGEYGVEPFTLEEIRDLAARAGVTIPTRVDKTFLSTKHEGKPLFKRAGSGGFRPTVQAEAYMKSTFGVRKGIKRRAGQA